jgi:protein SCO1/2
LLSLVRAMAGASSAHASVRPAAFASPKRGHVITTVLALSLASVLAFAGCTRGPSAELSEAWATSPLRDLALLDQDGHALSSEPLRGKTTLVNFMFASCGSICPAQTRALVKVLQPLPPSVRSEVRVLSVTVDPENDTPANLKRFASLHGAALDGWWFAAASPDDTTALLTRFSGSDPRAKDRGAHPTGVYLFDRSGRLMQRYDGSPIDHERLTREIQQLVALQNKATAIKQ